MTSIKKLFSSAAIYTGVSAINKGISFLFLPVFTRLLTPYDFGLVATFEAALGVTSPFVELGTTAAVARGYFQRAPGFDFPRYVTSALAVVGVAFSLVALFFFLCRNFLSGISGLAVNFILFVPFVALGTSGIEIATRIWIVKQKPIPNGVFRIAQSIFEIALSLTLIFSLSGAWKARVIGMGVSEITFFLLGLFFLLRWGLVRFPLERDYAKQILKYGLPLVIHSLNIWILFGIDRFFLNRMVGVAETGVYSAGYIIGSIIGVIGGAYGQAWTPILFEALSKEDKALDKKIVKLTYLSYLGVFIVTLLFIAVMPYFIKIFLSGSFQQAYAYVPWVAGGYAFQWMYRISSGYILYSKKTIFIPLITTVAAAVNILLNILLIKHNGAMGAAQATFWAYAVSFTLTWFLAQKAHPMPWLSFLRR
jgi:O-antigen/teichoic acid export membrane protein